MNAGIIKKKLQEYDVRECQSAYNYVGGGVVYDTARDYRTLCSCLFFKLKYWGRVLGCCRVVIAQWSERRQLRLEALGLILSGYTHAFFLQYVSILIYHQLLTTSSYHQLLLISIVTK